MSTSGNKCRSVVVWRCVIVGVDCGDSGHVVTVVVVVVARCRDGGWARLLLRHVHPSPYF